MRILTRFLPFLASSSCAAALIVVIELFPSRDRPNHAAIVMGGVSLGLIASMYGAFVYARTRRANREDISSESTWRSMVLASLLGASYPALLRATGFLIDGRIATPVWVGPLILLLPFALRAAAGSAAEHQPNSRSMRPLAFGERLAATTAIVAAQFAVLLFVDLPVGEHQLREQLPLWVACAAAAPLMVAVARPFRIAPALSTRAIGVAGIVGVAAALCIHEALLVERHEGDIVWLGFPFERRLEYGLFLGCMATAAFLGTCWTRAPSDPAGD